ncbi:MAG: hypothetical protein A2091_06910 [Desulfuromonadales bacterium GWD2_61_12]|nr:MAG: hypothetical protein A2091_06910 [Desulfuromonadales bacterium GWD2_61_12]OGR33329.1 MAG: hypothetical protein A2005_01770 [Desulfuromonadales bacterium GWC2_61_20]HAD05431.1 hypothetical protein [Desulfuromonas sp.]
MDSQQIYNYIRFEEPESVLKEILAILQRISPDFATENFTADYRVADRLYKGEFPGYRACNTDYHNFSHAMHTCLASARFIHGAILEGIMLPQRDISLTLSAAIYHDSGYLQEEGDSVGTGAKYTLQHIARGIRLFRGLRGNNGYSPAELDAVEALINGTDLAQNYEDIPYPRPSMELLGRLLDTADLTAQMADRAYLERLLLLFYEFQEAGIVAYVSEADILRKTVDFYAMIDRRLAGSAELCDRCMRSHFRHSADLDINPYQESIKRQKIYLQTILAQAESEPQTFLRRQGIVEHVRRKYESSPEEA